MQVTTHRDVINMSHNERVWIYDALILFFEKDIDFIITRCHLQWRKMKVKRISRGKRMFWQLQMDILAFSKSISVKIFFEYMRNIWFQRKKTEINFFRSLICSLKTRGSLIGNLLAKILAREALADLGSLPARIHGWVWMWLIRIRRGGEYVTRQKNSYGRKWQ